MCVLKVFRVINFVSFKMKRTLLAGLIVFFFTFSYGIRPFITDDARIVGARLAQCESWIRLDDLSCQQWNVAAYGPNDRLEISLGLVHGIELSPIAKNQYSYAMPLIQSKYLLKEYVPNKTPGIAIITGTFLPFGKGDFKAPNFNAFGYLALTESLGNNDLVLIHGNLGANYMHSQSGDLTVTWGVGTQIRTFGGLHFVGEVFSGDPYVPGSGMAFQTGFRYFVNDFVQVDVTMGEGFAGQHKLPLWGSLGVRMVTDWFKK